MASTYQFMFSGVTGLARGQKLKKKSGVMNNNAAILIGKPNLPKLQRRGGSGAPYKRRHNRQPIVTKYDARIETPPNELMAFSAVDDPRLIQASSEVMTKEMSTARMGMFQPGETCGGVSIIGLPHLRSRTSYVANEVAEW